MFLLRHILPDGKRGMNHDISKRQLRNVLWTLRDGKHQNWQITRVSDGVIVAQSKVCTVN
jgi:hypothetical protein